MRNLKKILALVMALVMSLSLVTIANASDFTDSDDITYEEAADVMSAIGIIEGYEDGSFDPDGTLTREEAATLITRMLMGSNADRLGVEGSSFVDVLTTRWSAPYIEYCYTVGIIDGNGDGTFTPAGTLTGYDFAKILLTALGYDSDKEGLVGTSWSINVAALAMEVGLDNGVEDMTWSSAITREQAAQMALNAIRTPMVAYESSGSITIGDSTVEIGSGDAYYITTTRASEQNISDERLSNSNEYTVEFGERYFPDLVLDSDTDDFGRPARTWTYNTEDIGTYMDTDLLVASYTDEVLGEDAYSDIGSNAVNNYGLTIYVDGVEDDWFDIDDISRSNDDELAETGVGVLTEIYVDHDAEEIIFVIVNTYLAEVASDYNSSTESLMLNVYDDVDTETPAALDSTYRAYLEDVDNLDEFEADDMVVTIADDTVASVELADTVSGVEATAYTVSGDRLDTVTADGTRYSTNAKAFYDAEVLYNYDLEELYDFSYDLYLDTYGNIIGIEQTDSSSNVVFVVGYELGSSVLSNAIDQALIITTTGEMMTVDVEMDDSDDRPSSSDATINKWYRYSLGSDGVYTLYDDVERQGAQDRSSGSGNVSSSNPRMYDASSTGGHTTVYGNSSTVYITVEADDSTVRDSNGSIVDVESVITGVRNVDIEVTDVGSGTDLSDIDANTYWVYNNSGYITYAIVIGENGGTSSSFAYIASGITSREYVSGVGYVNTYDAIVDGVLTKIQVSSSDVGSSRISADTLYEVDYDSDGYVVDMTAASVTADEDDIDTDLAESQEYIVVEDPSTPSVSGATLRIGSRGYLILDDEATFFVNDEDGDYVEYSTASSAINVATPVDEDDAEDGDVKSIEKISVVADSDTGYATMVVIYVDRYGSGTSGGSNTGSIRTVNLAFSSNGENLWLNLYDRNGEKVTSGSTDYTLYWRSTSQSSFDVYMTGTIDCATVAGSALLTNAPDGSYYIVVDGFDASNTVTRVSE